jgi:hypothetical protein
MRPSSLESTEAPTAAQRQIPARAPVPPGLAAFDKMAVLPHFEAIRIAVTSFPAKARTLDFRIAKRRNRHAHADDRIS